MSTWTLSENKNKKKTVKYKDGDYTNYCWYDLNSPQMLIERTGGIGYQRKNENNPDNSMVEINKNTEKSPGDLRYIIKEWFFYINHFSLIIFYHSVWLVFELFGLRVQVHSH